MSQSASIDYTTPAPRFSVLEDDSLNAGIAYLLEHGYAVISDILDPQGIARNKELLWTFLESYSNGSIERTDPETWAKEWPQFSTHGVINGDGIGQSELLWSVRSTPSVKKVFARIWKTRQLLTSFDGCCTFRDWRHNPAWKTNGGWNHVDQNPQTKPELCCIQGLVSLYDQNDRTGGLIVYPRTHLQFHELSDVVRNTNDFVKVRDDHPIMNEGQTPGKLVHCQAGDLILWDSRSVHCNSPAVTIEERKTDEPLDLLRAVVYVSMSPIQFIRDHSLEEFREKRKEFVENSVTTNHWSTGLLPSGGKNTGLPSLSLDRFTDYQKALIFGFEDQIEE